MKTVKFNYRFKSHREQNKNGVEKIKDMFDTMKTFQIP